MSFLVARHGRLLKGAHTSITTPCRPRSLPRLALPTTPRSYTNESNETSKSNKTKPLKIWKNSNRPVPDSTPPRVLSNNSAIVVPTSITDLQHEDILPHISPVSNSGTFAVFLVTPSFVPWLHDNVFLEKAVRKLYTFDTSNMTAEERSALRVHVLCAVVDKLPAASAIKENSSLGKTPPHRMLVPPVSEAGFEGIAYTTLTANASVSSSTHSPSGTGAIDFIFEDRTYTDTLRLPLANTVFQTGTPATMTLSTWSLSDNSDQIVLNTKENICYHGVKALRSNAMNQIAMAPSIPLIPLTFPRKVQGCMGNIIRQLVGPDEKLITASSELEQVVPRFFKSRGEPAQATSAWALVMSAKESGHMEHRTKGILSRQLNQEEIGAEKFQDRVDSLWEDLWRSDPPLWNKLVPTELSRGARLHRVLSGGGGWGKKAGLLSLDPVPITEESVEDLTSASEGSENFSSVLTPVVQDQDWIQFFISPTSTPNSEEALELENLSKGANSSETGVWGWELGCIPSTMDSLPGGSWQHSTPSDGRKVVAFKGSFGALTEKGLMLTRHYKVPKKGLDLVQTTMVDVPFSRFSAVKVETKVETQVKKKGKKKAESSEHSAHGEGLAGDLRADMTKKTSTLRIRKLVKTYPDKATLPIEKISSPSKFLCIRKVATPPPATPSDAVPIRKLTSTPITIITSRTATDRYNRTSKMVSRLSEEHRAIMSEIRRRERYQLRLSRALTNNKKNGLKQPGDVQLLTPPTTTTSPTTGRIKYSMRGKGQVSQTHKPKIPAKPKLRRVGNTVIRQRLSRPRGRAGRLVLREDILRQVVDEKKRPGKEGALRTFRGKREEKRRKELEDRVEGWLSGGS